MKKGKSLLQLAGIGVVCVAVFLVGVEARGATEPAKPPETGRADLIKIDTLAAYGALELPPVTFFHDRHTDALLKDQKNCETCHVVEDGKLSLAYQRTKATKPDQIKDIYHAGCIGCHTDMAAAKQKTGPLDGFCRACHNAEPAAATRLDAGLNKVSHFRHVDAKSIPAPAGGKTNCGTCHHDYDQQAKKIYYAPGKEESCRACHLDKPQDRVLSLQQAAHQQCVLCHLDLGRQNVQGPLPVRCADCHSEAGQALTAKRNEEVVARFKGEIPRLQRGQPDAVLLTYEASVAREPGAKPAVMNPVAFNHQAHEKYADSCRSCHHTTMDACGKCHTLSGAKDGKFVTFEQAMHRKSSPNSCVGCHAAQQAAPNCAGCHNSMVETGRPGDNASCRQCHTPLPGAVETRRDIIPLSKERKAEIAEVILKSRKPNTGTYPVSDIPDKVVIKQLSDQYEPVEMAHRKHVSDLAKGMQDNQLAKYFHPDPGTLCQGCHHNSPASKTPPGCGNCHAKPHGQTAFNPQEANRPGLLAAYHDQCMRCHKDMGVKPVATACAECHKEKQKLALDRK